MWSKFPIIHKYGKLPFMWGFNLSLVLITLSDVSHSWCSNVHCCLSQLYQVESSNKLTSLGLRLSYLTLPSTFQVSRCCWRRRSTRSRRRRSWSRSRPTASSKNGASETRPIFSVQTIFSFCSRSTEMSKDRRKIVPPRLFLFHPFRKNSSVREFQFVRISRLFCWNGTSVCFPPAKIRFVQFSLEGRSTSTPNRVLSTIWWKLSLKFIFLFQIKTLQKMFKRELKQLISLVFNK